jgi:putative (di)nucleoside polyphosphate hydrolase
MPPHPGYRPCAGVALVNAAGDVFIGRRRRERNVALADGREWQMPQGGIDDGEAPLAAARRELHEETNVRSAALLAEAPEWLAYDLPEDARGRFAGRYRGQTQKWFLFRFEGDDAEIDIHHPAGGAHKAEFSAWRWERWEALPDLVVPFKREVYLQVVAWFAPTARAQRPASIS